MKVLYTKFPKGRRDEFALETQILEDGDNKYVVKRAQNPSAISHVKSFEKNMGLLQKIYGGDVSVCPVTIKNDEAVFKYIDGQSFCELFNNALENGDAAVIRQLIDKFTSIIRGSNNPLQKFRETQAFREIFGDIYAADKDAPCFAVTNLDAGPANILCANGSYFLIDYEWVFDFPIPMDFAYYRNLAVLFFYSGLNFEPRFDFHKICAECGVSMDFGLLEKMNVRFHNWIFGAPGQQKYAAETFLNYKKPSFHIVSNRYEGAFKVIFHSGAAKELGSELCLIKNGKINSELKIPKDCAKISIEFNTEGLCVELEGFCARFNGNSKKANISGLQNVRGVYCFAGRATFKTRVPKKGGSILITGDAFVRRHKTEVKGRPADTRRCQTENNGQTQNNDNELARVNSRPLKRGNTFLKKAGKKIKFKLRTLMAPEQLPISADDIQNICQKTEGFKLDSRAQNTAVKKTQYKDISLNAAAILKKKIEGALLSFGSGSRRDARIIWKKAAGGKKISDNLLCAIDNYAYNDSCLHIDGWLFAKRLRVEKAFIAAEYDGSIYCAPLKYPFDRSDVADILKDVAARFSGFSADIIIVAGKPVKLYALLVSGDYTASACLEIFENTTGSVTEGEFLFLPLTDNRERLKKLHPPAPYKIVSHNGNSFLLPDGFCADIIIPVYNGFEYLNKLFENIAEIKTAYNLTVIDDASTDKRVPEFLDAFAKHRGNVTVIHNSKNLGFVNSVNLGFERAKNHIALLNTDIELPADWLPRLMAPLLNGHASSTPFSNSATLMSFPNIGKDNKLMFGLSVDETDKYFRDIQPSYTKLPTGVGFCMGINYDVLRVIGGFDSAFGKGYGEENDWCMRAEKAGYKNAAVENLFVYHKHGGSFISEEKTELQKEHMDIINKRYPSYGAEIKSFFKADPLNAIRRESALRIIKDNLKKPPVLVFSHSLDGGAESYLQKKIKAGLTKGLAYYVIKCKYRPILHELFNFEGTFYYKDTCCKFDYDDFNELKADLGAMPVSGILINELYTYPDIEGLLSFIISLKKKFQAPITMLLHDYYPICYSCNLLDADVKYCGVPEDKTACSACLKRQLKPEIFNTPDILAWRGIWKDFLSNTDKILVFSESSKELLERAYGSLPQITVKPHSVDYITPAKKNKKLKNTINIGFIGALSQAKGFGILEEMLRIANAKKAPVNFILVGYPEKNITDKRLKITGKYKREDLPDIVEKYDIDVFFISSIWPETFSYTAEEAMGTGIPTACFNLGAPAERISKYNKGLIVSKIDAAAAFEEIVRFISGLTGNN